MIACPTTIQDEYSTAKCQHYLGIFTIAVIGTEDVTLAATQVQNQAKAFIRNGDLQSHVPEEAQEDFIFYSLDDGTAEDEFPLIAILGVATGAVLIGLLSVRALMVNRRSRGSQKVSGDEYVDLFPPGCRCRWNCRDETQATALERLEIGCLQLTRDLEI